MLHEGAARVLFLGLEENSTSVNSVVWQWLPVRQEASDEHTWV
jgi:hypothetical protein